MGEAMRDQYPVTCSAGPGDSHGASQCSHIPGESLPGAAGMEGNLTASSHNRLHSPAPGKGLRYLRAKPRSV